jgi:hypothetical protein
MADKIKTDLSSKNFEEDARLIFNSASLLLNQVKGNLDRNLLD